MSTNENKLTAPKNLNIKCGDNCITSYWNEVPEADGYILSFYNSERSEMPFKTRYSQNCSKTILGFSNGQRYFVRVRAFKNIGGKEIYGELSEAVLAIPISNKLKAQNTICLTVGDSEQIVCEYKNVVPTVNYRSSDRDVAYVNSEGLVTAQSKGSCVITVSMDSGESTQVNIRVARNLERTDKKRAVIMLAGDLMCSLNHQRKAVKRNFDFTYSFDEIRDILNSADYSVGVLETVCYDNAPFECEQKRTFSGSPNCNSPSTFIEAVKYGGFDAVVTANNHNCDCAGNGLLKTVDIIKNNGLTNIGTLGDNPVLVDINGIKVAFIACNMISNGLEENMFAMGDEANHARIIGKYTRESFSEFADKAKAMGAEYIIGYQHFGKMNSSQVRAYQQTAAQEMADCGADLIVGSHPHVMQRAEYINAADGRRVLCCYSLGNFLTSMNEMTENTESALLRVSLERTAKGISSQTAYIPVISSDINDRVVVRDVKPSEINKYSRITSQVGGAVLPYTEKVLAQGSVVLRSLFEDNKKFNTDLTPLLLSPVSIMSGQAGKADKAGLDRVKMDIQKCFSDYIDRSDADYIVLDFYTAAAVSLYKMDDTYYTATQGFLKSDFYKRHRDDMEQIKQPVDESIWQPAIKKYAKLLLKRFGKNRIILIRLSFSDKAAKKNMLRNSTGRAGLNKRIMAMEQCFIDAANPVVIDVAGYYFADASVNSPSAYEPYFYSHAKNILEDIIYNKTPRFYFDNLDYSIFIDRVVYYYKNMTDRAYFGWLLDESFAADKLMRYSSPQFILKYKPQLIALKKAKCRDLNEAAAMFSDNSVLSEFVNVIKAIKLLTDGDITKPYEEYAVVFDLDLSAVSLAAKLLSGYTGEDIPPDIARAVCLIKEDKRMLKSYLENLDRVKVDIWGSCISRETVNRCKTKISVNKYIFKQPHILIDGENIDVEIPPADKFCNNSWRRRTVKEAFYHEGREILQNSGSPWLIVDFYDLICKMARYKNGYLEVDDFVMRTEFYKSIYEQTRLTYLFKEMDIQQSIAGLKSFSQFVKERYKNNIILVKADLKNEFITLDKTIEPLSDSDNTFSDKKTYISQMEDMFIKYTDCYVVEVSDRFYADDSFPLGGAHIVHYEDEFYSCCCNHILEILSGSTTKHHSTVNENYLIERDYLLER